MKLDRFTLCLEKGLLAKLDGLAAERGYPSRSQAVADFVRRAMVKKDWKAGRECAGTISVHYDPADGRPARAVETVLVRQARNVAATQAVLLKNGHVLLTAAVTGKPADLQRLADELRAIKGVTHGALSIVAPL
ncbi:MAG TPA: CopG family ribbon-helix-helix protein [Elusimicrobiales bacterium]|nr:CopG family ribbon-helix-helix protein [Elusimicrobiales bacterium]